MIFNKAAKPEATFKKFIISKTIQLKPDWNKKKRKTLMKSMDYQCFQVNLTLKNNFKAKKKLKSYLYGQLQIEIIKR